MFHFRWAEKLDRLTSTATKDPEGFVGHPVNAFKLMKRLNTEWSESWRIWSLRICQMVSQMVKLTSQKKGIFGTACRNAKRSDKFKFPEHQVFSLITELLLKCV